MKNTHQHITHLYPKFVETWNIYTVSKLIDGRKFFT